jgi:hypothetical protein
MLVEERLATGEYYTKVIGRNVKKSPLVDRNGKRCVISETYKVYNREFDQSDRRSLVAKTHRYITDTGEVGGSGKHDPRSIELPDGSRLLRLLDHPDQKCVLCEDEGDMVKPLDRFRDSTYRPGYHFWHDLYWWFRGKMKA